MSSKNELSQEQATEIVKKKRGSKPASITENNSATPSEIQDMIGNALYWYKRDIVKSDEECAERLNEFFQHCQQNGEIPTVEKMCLALGTTRTTVYRWEQGELTATRSNIIKKAKEILAAIDAELVSHNKIPQVTYIFRAKNFFGMSDKTEVVLAPQNPLDNLNTDEARKRLTESMPDEE